MDRSESVIQTDLPLKTFIWPAYDKTEDQIVAKQK
jgi:hypothetical protein